MHLVQTWLRFLWCTHLYLMRLKKFTLKKWLQCSTKMLLDEEISFWKKFLHIPWSPLDLSRWNKFFNLGRWMWGNSICLEEKLLFVEIIPGTKLRSKSVLGEKGRYFRTFLSLKLWLEFCLLSTEGLCLFSKLFCRLDLLCCGFPRCCFVWLICVYRKDCC